MEINKYSITINNLKKEQNAITGLIIYYKIIKL